MRLQTKFEYPPFLKLWIGPFPVIIISNSEAVHQVLSAKSKNFIKGSFFQILRKYIGEALFNVEGETWKVHRHLLNPAFKSENIRIIANEVFPKQISHMIEKWDSLTHSSDAQVDIVESISKVTLDMIADASFGYSVNASKGTEGNLSKKLPHDIIESGIIFSSFKYIVKMASFIVALPDFMLKTFVQRRDNIMSYIVEKILEKKPDEENGEKHALNILQHMKESGKLSESEMKEEIFGLLLAGHETTATLLVWIIIYLAKYPQHRQKVNYCKQLK